MRNKTDRTTTHNMALFFPGMRRKEKDCSFLKKGDAGAPMLYADLQRTLASQLPVFKNSF